METMWKLANFRTGAWLGVALGLLLLAMVTVGQAASEPAKKGVGEQKPIQGQQLCPPPGAQGQCQVQIDCPPMKAPGQTTCQATIDCPPIPEKKPQ